MLEKIIEITTYLFMGYLLFKIIYKNYKLCKETDNSIEKIVYFAFVTIIGIPYAVYLLDRYNIPSFFGFMKNVNTSDWLNFIVAYSSAIIASILSAMFLFFVTKQQIERTYKDNVLLNEESYRIQNLPFLKYKLLYDIEHIEDFVETKWIMVDSNENNSPVKFTISIKNAGLNSIRKLFMKINSEIMQKNEVIEFDNQGCIEKGETINKGFIITGLGKDNYIFWIKIYYQDLMKNWYEQKVKLNIQLTNIRDGQRNFLVNFQVFDEIKINELSVEIN